MRFLAIAMIQCIEGKRDALEYTQKVQIVGRCPSGICVRGPSTRFTGTLQSQNLLSVLLRIYMIGAKGGAGFGNIGGAITLFELGCRDMEGSLLISVETWR